MFFTLATKFFFCADRKITGNQNIVNSCVLFPVKYMVIIVMNNVKHTVPILTQQMRISTNNVYY
jgi:hypothetical protein